MPATRHPRERRLDLGLRPRRRLRRRRSPGPGHIRGRSARRQLVILGPDAAQVGHGNPQGGGLRTLDLFGGRGFFLFLALERLQLIVITQVTWTD
jgi:hypothetical protein